MTYNGYTIIGSSTSVTDFDAMDDDGARTKTISNIQFNGKLAIYGSFTDHTLFLIGSGLDENRGLYCKYSSAYFGKVQS